tara:strand:+ start:759 stop:980 length:222 start_codon:yes stop_codon:yes gene_type:complete
MAKKTEVKEGKTYISEKEFKAIKSEPKVDPFDERLKDIESDLKMAGKTVDELNQSINAISDLLNRVADRMGMK